MSNTQDNKPANAMPENKLYTAEDMRVFASEAWKSAANAFRMYPDNKHTWADFWHDYGKSFLQTMFIPVIPIKEEAGKEVERESIEIRDAYKWPPDKDGWYWCIAEGRPRALGMMLVWLRYSKEEGGFLQEDDNFRVLHYLTKHIPAIAKEWMDKQTIEQAAEKAFPSGIPPYYNRMRQEGFIKGANWASNHSGIREAEIKKAKTDLIWEMIMEWQDADDDQFSKNDIEVDLYGWLEKIDKNILANNPPSGNGNEGKAFDAGLTLANNMLIQLSNRYNDDDFISEANVLSSAASEIRSNIGDRIWLNEYMKTIPPQSSNGTPENREAAATGFDSEYLAINPYNSPYPSEVMYKSDKNFIVRLKSMIERRMKEAGYNPANDFIASFFDAEDCLFESKIQAI